MLPAVAALAALGTITVSSHAAGPCRDQQPEGPAVTIASKDEPGTRMYLHGVIFDASTGKPLPGITLYVYQTDAQGYYSANRGMNNRNPRLCGILRSGPDGGYEVETIRPADYATGGVEAHIHFQAWSDAIERQAFLLEFEENVTQVARGAKVPAPSGRATAVTQPVYRLADGTLNVRRDIGIRR
jgi:protocatechuate 3,4-dioxygenase beta subunit